MRQNTIQLSTPDALRGRVTGVNSVFISASNQLGARESGLVAALTDPVFAVVSGGIGLIELLAEDPPAPGSRHPPGILGRGETSVALVEDLAHVYRKVEKRAAIAAPSAARAVVPSVASDHRPVLVESTRAQTVLAFCSWYSAMSS